MSTAAIEYQKLTAARAASKEITAAQMFAKGMPEGQWQSFCVASQR